MVRAWGKAMARHFSSREDFEHVKRHGVRTGCSPHITVTDGIAVHSRVVLRGNVTQRDDTFGSHAMQRVDQRDLFHPHGLDAAQHHLLGVDDPDRLVHTLFLSAVRSMPCGRAPLHLFASCWPHAGAGAGRPPRAPSQARPCCRSPTQILSDEGESVPCLHGALQRMGEIKHGIIHQDFNMLGQITRLRIP